MIITYSTFYTVGNFPIDDTALQRLHEHHWKSRTLLREPRASELDKEICFQAYKDFENPGEGMREFERLTGLDVVLETSANELGGSFFELGDGTFCYGEGCIEHLYSGVRVKNLRDAVTQLHACRADYQVLRKRVASLEKALQLAPGVPKDSRRKRSDEPWAG